MAKSVPKAIPFMGERKQRSVITDIRIAHMAADCRSTGKHRRLECHESLRTKPDFSLAHCIR